MHLLLAVVLQLLFVFLKLNELVVEHLDFGLLCGQYIFVVAHQTVVVHLCIALVTHSVECRIVATQLPSLVTAHLADGLAASLTIFLGVPMHHFQPPCEGRLTELALFGVLHPHTFQVKGRWQDGRIEQPT